MKKVMFIFIGLVFFTSSLFSFDSCSQNNRIYAYERLNKDIKFLVDSLPAFSPKEKSFFELAWQKYVRGERKKYERIISSNDFVSYSNAKNLKYFQEDIIGIINANKHKNLDEEIKLLFSILSDYLYEVHSFGGYKDSELMYERKMVNKEYQFTAQGVHFTLGAISDCGYNIVRQIKSKNHK